MTESPGQYNGQPQSSRLDRIEQILEGMVIQQAQLQQNQVELQRIIQRNSKAIAKLTEAGK